MPEVTVEPTVEESWEVVDWAGLVEPELTVVPDDKVVTTVEE